MRDIHYLIQYSIACLEFQDIPRNISGRRHLFFFPLRKGRLCTDRNGKFLFVEEVFPEKPFEKGKRFCFFVCRRGFVKFLLPKGNDSTFSLPKRKSCKKKLANLRFDRLCVWERKRAKPGKALGKASRQVGTQFPSRNRGGFRTFTRFFVRVRCVWGLSYGAPTGRLLPPKGICPHGVR